MVAAGIAPGHGPPVAALRPLPHPSRDKIGQALAPGSGSGSRWKDALEGSGQEPGGLRGIRSRRWGWRGSLLCAVCRIPSVPGCWAGRARRPPALPWDSSGSEPPGMTLPGPFSCAGAAPPPRFALKRSEPVQLRPLPGSACSAPPAFALAEGGKLRSGFALWVYLAQPGFGRNPRQGFWQRGELRALARAGPSVCTERDGSRRGRGHGEHSAGKGSQRDKPLARWAPCQCLWESPAAWMSLVAQEDPPGKVNWDGQAEEGAGGAEEAEVPRVPPPCRCLFPAPALLRMSSLPRFGRGGVKSKRPS